MEDSGSSRIVHRILNAEWATAMPVSDAGASSSAGRNRTESTLNTVSQTIVPMILKDKCTTAARFAFLFVPKEERMAVIQVPIFCPIMMGTAAP